MSTTFIYGLFDPRNCQLKYIGKTDNLKSRLRSHIGEAKRGGRRYKDNWIRSLLKEGLTPEIEILEEVPFDDWESAESAWISEAREKGVRLVNTTSGGEGASGCKHTNEHKRKISEGAKKNWADRKALGYKHSEEARKNMSNAHLNMPNEYKDKLREQLKKLDRSGYKHSDETKKKIGNKLAGQKTRLGASHSEETKQKMRDTWARKKLNGDNSK